MVEIRGNFEDSFPTFIITESASQKAARKTYFPGQKSFQILRRNQYLKPPTSFVSNFVQRLQNSELFFARKSLELFEKGRGLCLKNLYKILAKPTVQSLDQKFAGFLDLVHSDPINGLEIGARSCLEFGDFCIGALIKFYPVVDKILQEFENPTNQIVTRKAKRKSSSKSQKNIIAEPLNIECSCNQENRIPEEAKDEILKAVDQIRKDIENPKSPMSPMARHAASGINAQFIRLFINFYLLFYFGIGFVYFICNFSFVQ